FEAGDPDSRNYERLVFAGALVQDKGIHLLVEAFAALKPRYPKLVLDVYGSGSMWGRKDLFDTEAVARVQPDIHFHGAVSQEVVAKAYREGGIAVVPSIWFDPFPLTAVEAQVAGCPVVTFNVGGLGEGVIHGETGIVLSEISAEALAKALDELLSARTQLREMSRRALEVQRPRFSWENVAAGIAKLAEGTDAKTGASTQRIHKKI